MHFLRKGFLLILFILPLLANAQFRAGLTGGAVLSSLVRDNQINSSAGKVGYLLGLSAKLNLGELGWFLQSGAHYTLEGDTKQPLNFIKIPLGLGLDFSDDVGVYVAYDLAWLVGNQNNVQDFYNNFANMLAIGSDIDITDSFGLGFRLNYGLSNLVKDAAAAENFNIRPLTFDLYLNYYIIK